MEIIYKTNKLEKTVESPSAILKNYGTRAKLVNQRLKELEAAKSLEDFRFIPKANCHLLEPKKDGIFAVDISGNHRIIFEPNHNPIPLKEDGGFDWTQIISIKILDIGEDYH